MDFLSLPTDCIRDILDAAAASDIPLSACGESCRQLARLSHAKRCSRFRFTLRSPKGDLQPWGEDKLSFASSDGVREHVRFIAIDRPAGDARAQEAGDYLLERCGRLERLDLTAFRPGQSAWKALGQSHLNSLALHAVSGSPDSDLPQGFDNLQELRVTFALQAGTEVLARCRGPVRLLSLRHFEAPDFTKCFPSSLWDSLVRLSLDCGISASASEFVTLFEGFRDHATSCGHPLPLRQVHIESRRLHISGFFEIITCLKGQPLTELSLMVISEAPKEMLEHICDCLPTLEKLNMLYYAEGLLRITDWPHEAAVYTKLLARLPRLHTFGFNHRAFTMEPIVTDENAPPPIAKEQVVWDLDSIIKFMGSHPSLMKLVFFGLTAAQLGPTTSDQLAGLDPSLHYRGRAFVRDAAGQLKLDDDVLFFPL